MKANTFNICPTCTHREYCVLTDLKSQVWSCSEYDEKTSNVIFEEKKTPEANTEFKPDMAGVSII
jgi:ssDNA-binding Zn-finger/Zn-ribbon topoisomerase 1